MVTSKSLGTGDIPLRFSRALTAIVNKEWDEGTLLEKVTPTTAELLRYWFDEAFVQERDINFHIGQKQAVLNAIYTQEVLKCDNVLEMYEHIQPGLLGEMNFLDLTKEKYDTPKYCIKMATGTGKTWVMGALLMWQYLNAKREDTPSGRFSKNFLFIAPGLIVYERLLDAYLGKEQEDGSRNFAESDFKRFEDLFIPPAFRDEIFGFIQSCVVKKEEISTKVTGDGLIAITNWHLLAEEEEQLEREPHEEPWAVIKDAIPLRPGRTGGNDLNSLDAQYLRGRELQYLTNLSDLVVFNDEAHHLGELKVSGEIFEKKWQEALIKIASPKGKRYLQLDFSATPYVITGSGQKRTRHHFPHIIVDFNLPTAIRSGLVKIVALDKRKEIAAIPLDFKADRTEDGRVIGLSEGQRTMLRAGITKLKRLEEEFISLDSTKYPKLLVICEDTKVVPLVTDFLKTYEGISEDEILEIHSNRKGEIPKEEWDSDKQKLFSLDKHPKPKIIISVLMLREGFDVNNICVIVPLRSSNSLILLEQIVGRGLRLMWRGPDYVEVKQENRIRLLDKKESPTNYLDLLSVVEHPAYAEFYDELMKEGALGEVSDELKNKQAILGDIIKVELKEDYEKYDIYIPQIIRNKEEELATPHLDYNTFDVFPIALDTLKVMVGDRKGDTFYGEEITVKTRFGEYQVSSEIFTAKSYNDFLSKVVKAITERKESLTKRRKTKTFPMMQINNAELMGAVDGYVRHKLFNSEFDPFENENWRVLMLPREGIIQHILRNLSQAIYDMQHNVDISKAEIVKKWFSEVPELKMRENYSITISKSIFPRLKYPSNKGGFEKTFMEFIDADSQVTSFMKVEEYAHHFANIIYIREDGLLAHYYPDFIVRIEDKVYIVETKAQVNISQENVQQKRKATLDLVKKINELEPEDRMDATWEYVVLGDRTFKELREAGGSTKDILENAKMTASKVNGTLEDFLI
jgi:type III restriction enzyme